MPQKPHTYQTIQLLRGIAALLVVCFHVGLLQSGYKGVDLFFVISGFVIYRSTIPLIGTGFKNGQYFLLKRLIRIFTPYWSILLLLLCIGYYNNLVSPPLSPLQQMAAILLLPGHISFFEVTWSLSYEVYFYFLYSTVIFFHFKWRFLKLLLVTGLAMASVITFLFAICPYLENREVSFLSGRYVWEFLLGISAAALPLKLPHSNKASFIIFFIVFSAFLGINLAYDSSNTTVIYGLLAVTSVLLITNIEDHTFLKIPRLWVIAGDASYITYLIHVPVREIIFRHIAPVVAAKIGYIIMVQLLSIAIHLLYEKKLLKKLNAAAKQLVFHKGQV